MRKIRLLVILFCIPFAGIAQEMSDSIASAKKKIRDIKLSELYVYAEANTPVSLAEARQNSLDLLHIRVTGILTGQLDMKKKEVDKKWRAIEDQCRNIVIKIGDLYKVFTYVEKEVFIPGSSRKQKAVAEVPPPAVQSQQIVKDTVTVVIEKIPTAEQKQVKEEFPALKGLSGQAHDIVRKVFEMKTFKELLGFLQEEKKEGRLAYGSIQQCKSLEQSYLVIFKNGEFVTVLDKGRETRLNFKTNTSDSLIDYVGHTIVWFQVF